MGKSHNLKTIPPYWEQVASGLKKFELRKNDRDYQVGDILNLFEFVLGEGYTGNVCNVRVNYVLEGFSGLQDGYCILGIEPYEVPF